MLNPDSLERSKHIGRWRWLRPKDREVIFHLRSNPTGAEDALWNVLRKKQLCGFKFRRQHKIDRFVVDFYCHSAKVGVEADGQIHDKFTERDSERTKKLEELGLIVLRFDNHQILSDIDSAKKIIINHLKPRP